MNKKIDRAKLKATLEKYKYVAAVLLVGLFLMLLPTGKSEDTAQPDITSAANAFDLAALEQKLERALSQISGVGETTVVLTLRNGGEEVLAQDINQGDGYETETVIISASGNTEQPVSIKTIYPEFQGALVICEGAGSATVKLQILQAVSAITGLSSDRISICQRK